MPDLTHAAAQVFGGLADETVDALVHGFDDDQLATIAAFLEQATDFTLRRTAQLRGQALVTGRSSRSTAAPWSGGSKPSTTSSRTSRWSTPPGRSGWRGGGGALGTTPSAHRTAFRATSRP